MLKMFVKIFQACGVQPMGPRSLYIANIYTFIMQEGLQEEFEPSLA